MQRSDFIAVLRTRVPLHGRDHLERNCHGLQTGSMSLLYDHCLVTACAAIGLYLEWKFFQANLRTRMSC